MKNQLFILFLFCCLASSAQTNKSVQQNKDTLIGQQRLLYQVSAAKTLFLPVIEDLLRTLTFSGGEVHFFERINSLNNLTEGAEIRGGISHTMNYYSLGSLPYQIKSTKPLDDDILQQIVGNGLFLDIKIIEISPSFYEYQLNLFHYQTSDVKEKSFNIYPDPGTIHRSASIVIDPLNGNYKQTLLRGLKKIFKEANEPPVPNIHGVNGRLHGDTMTIFEYDTLKLRADVTDNDSPEEDMIYTWQVSGMPGYSAFIGDADKQTELLFYVHGIYRLFLKVSDGIADSTMECNIVVLKKPAIKNIDNPKLNDFYPGAVRMNYLGFIRHYYDRADIYCYDDVIVGDHNDDKLQFFLQTKDSVNLKNVIFQLADIPLDYRREREDNKTALILDQEPNSSKFYISFPRDSSFEVHVPQGIDVPAKYVLTLTPTASGLAGEPKQLALNFYRIRRLFFQIGIQGEVPTYPGGPNLAIKGGVGYTVFPFTAEKVNICFNQGIYLFRPELKTYSSMLDFQELYIEKPLRKGPFSFRLGVRNVYFDYYTPSGTQLKAEPYLFSGVDWIFSNQLSKQRISLTWAGQYNYNSLTTNIFTLGYCIDIYSAKKR